jgi:multidrug efflux pump subunit AcrA (membrane-fusion protein)
VLARSVLAPLALRRATQSLTKPDYDQAQARFDSTLAAMSQSKAALRQAQLSLGDSDLKAPFSGFILAGNIDVRALTSSSSAAFTIADTSAVKVSFGVPEDSLNLVHLGQSLTLQVQNDAVQYSRPPRQRARRMVLIAMRRRRIPVTQSASQ